MKNRKWLHITISQPEDQKELFNKRFELLCKCHHVNKFLLKNYTRNDFR